jgi:hypothetical protein
MEKLLAALLANAWTKGIAALFVAFEIYNIGIIPAWYGTLELNKLKSDLAIATQKADNAEQRQKSEAENIANQAVAKLAEAKAAVQQESSLADQAEAEAITAEQTAIPSPERLKAEADSKRSEAQIKLADAKHARDQAQADADLAERQVQKLKGDAALAQASVSGQIQQSEADRQLSEAQLKLFIGSPLPDLTGQ